MGNTKKPVITYITNCYAPPDQISVGAAARHYYHTEALASAGWHVEIITASESTISGSKLEVNNNKPEIKVNAVSVNTISSNNIISRFGYHAHFFFRSFLASLKTSEPSLVVASIPSLLIGWQGYITAILRKTKFLIDVRDLWTDSLSTTSLAQLPFFLTINRFLEKLLYQRADFITCTSKAQSDEIRKMVSGQVPVLYVPNGLDPEITVIPSNPHPFINKIRMKYQWVGLFAGKHSHYTALDTLLTAAKELEKDKFAFLLIGGGYTKERLIKQSMEEGINNVFFHDPVPKKEISSFLMGADIFFINYSPAKAWQNVLPNKIFDYMYWNRPIIAAVVPGEITQILSESGAGVSVPPGDASAIIRAVRYFIQNTSWECNSQRYLMKYFNRQNTVKHFVKACHLCMKEKN